MNHEATSKRPSFGQRSVHLQVQSVPDIHQEVRCRVDAGWDKEWTSQAPSLHPLFISVVQSGSVAHIGSIGTAAITARQALTGCLTDEGRFLEASTPANSSRGSMFDRR